MNNSPLLALLRAVPRPAAIIDRRGAILDINASFRALCGPPRLPDAAAAYSDGAHSERLRRVLGLDRPGWRGAEITLLLHGKPRLCWCEVHSLTIEGQLLHFLELHDMEQLRALEAAYLNHIRRVADDNLWVLDENGVLLWVRAENEAYGRFIDRLAHEAILPDDWMIWNAAMAEAQAAPGKPAECALRSVLDGRSRYVDLCWLPGGIFGGRFYAASRTTEPLGCKVVRRLKEAWAVRDDKELAVKLGTSGAAVSRANKNETAPAAWLIKTGEQTGFSIDWLLTGQGNKRRI